jgi:hypothetical protein
MLVLVIDDERRFDPNLCAKSRVDAEHFTSSMDGFKRILQAIQDDEIIDELWLDHDLGDGDTTRDLVLMMCEDCVMGKPWPIRNIYIHSANPVGQEWLWGMLVIYYEAHKVYSAAEQGLVKETQT